tara:strand:- start:35 stop:244 length:210 start_codon:yes stop_codon:yes gene_type:complete
MNTKPKFVFIDDGGNSEELPVNQNYIRDIKIRAMYVTLKDMNKSYTGSTKYLSEKFGLSEKRIEFIIKK